MKQTLIISIVLLLLLPILRNGLAFFHYIVEHTHLLCLSDLEHTHPDNCLTLTIFQSPPNQNQLPSPTKLEIQEIKLYCLTDCRNLDSTDFLTIRQVNFLNAFCFSNQMEKMSIWFYLPMEFAQNVGFRISTFLRW